MIDADPKRASSSRLLEDYFVRYYEEVRRKLPNHVPDLPKSGSVPPFFGNHARIVSVSECEDGYVVSLRAASDDPHDGADGTVAGPETFEMDAGHRYWTVEEVTGRGYPPHSDFWESEMFMPREVGIEQKYAGRGAGDERRDYISNSRAARLTAATAREDARDDLREFFEQSPAWGERGASDTFEEKDPKPPNGTETLGRETTGGPNLTAAATGPDKAGRPRWRRLFGR